MDIRERWNDPQMALRAALAGHQAGLWTALPGVIQSFDANAVTAVVQPAIQGIVSAQDGSATHVNLPLVPDVPVFFPRGGGFTLTFPVAAGDECLLVFASRCIDSWWELGGVQPQLSARMHDLSDAFALVGPMSQARKISGISTSTVQLRSDDGQSYVEMAAGHAVNIKAPGGCNINGVVIDAKGNVNAPGEVTAMGSHTVSKHVHADPQGGTVSPPQG